MAILFLSLRLYSNDVLNHDFVQRVVFECEPDDDRVCACGRDLFGVIQKVMYDQPICFRSAVQRKCAVGVRYGGAQIGGVRSLHNDCRTGYRLLLLVGYDAGNLLRMYRCNAA